MEECDFLHFYLFIIFTQQILCVCMCIFFLSTTSQGNMHKKKLKKIKLTLGKSVSLTQHIDKVFPHWHL